MESTQNKIYEIEDQEAKHAFNKNQEKGGLWQNEDFESKSDYGDKGDLQKQDLVATNTNEKALAI